MGWFGLESAFSTAHLEPREGLGRAGGGVGFGDVLGWRGLGIAGERLSRAVSSGMHWP